MSEAAKYPQILHHYESNDGTKVTATEVERNKFTVHSHDPYEDEDTNEEFTDLKLAVNAWCRALACCLNPYAGLTGCDLMTFDLGQFY